MHIEEWSTTDQRQAESFILIIKELDAPYSISIEFLS